MSLMSKVKLTVDAAKKVTYVETGFTVISPRYIADVIEREFGFRPEVDNVKRTDTGIQIDICFTERLYDDDPMRRDTLFSRRLKKYVKKFHNVRITDEDYGDDVRVWIITYEIPIGNPTYVAE